MSEIVSDAPLNLRDFKRNSAKSVDPASGEVKVQQATPQPKLVARDVEIQLLYVSPEDGKEQRATVISRVPDFDITLRMSRMEADMCQGRLFAALAPDRQDWVRMISCITHQLQDAPEWVLEWAAQDQAFLRGIYERCKVHEMLFFRPGAASIGATQSETRMEITSSLDERLEALRSPAAVRGGSDKTGG